MFKVISRSTFDLRMVFKTLVESAARLCEADKGTIYDRTRRATTFIVRSSYAFRPLIRGVASRSVS